VLRYSITGLSISHPQQNRLTKLNTSTSRQKEKLASERNSAVKRVIVECCGHYDKYKVSDRGIISRCEVASISESKLSVVFVLERKTCV
jgi:hypothetical protein